MNEEKKVDEATIYVGTPLEAEKHAKLGALARRSERKIAGELRVAIDRHLAAAEVKAERDAGDDSVS